MNWPLIGAWSSRTPLGRYEAARWEAERLFGAPWQTIAAFLQDRIDELDAEQDDDANGS